MDFHPELEAALASLVRAWPWIIGLAVIFFLAATIVWRLWPVSYIHTSLKSAVAPYSAANVSRWTIYHVWSSTALRGQEFVVLKIVGDYILIAVLKHDWIFRKRNDQCDFKGWTKLVHHDQLINPHDLLKDYPRSPIG